MRILALTAALLFAAPAYADEVESLPDVPAGNALEGQELAQNLCAGCHALVPDAMSPNPDAPNFNTLVLAYPPEFLAEGFAEGIVVGTEAHVAMPQFELTTAQIDNLIAYLDTVLPPPDIPEESTIETEEEAEEAEAL